MATSSGRPPKVGNRIRQLRLAMGYSRPALAQEMECSIESLARWERNDQLPQGMNLIKLCELLDCKVGDLGLHSIRPMATL